MSMKKLSVLVSGQAIFGTVFNRPNIVQAKFIGVIIKVESDTVKLMGKWKRKGTNYVI